MCEELKENEDSSEGEGAGKVPLSFICLLSSRRGRRAPIAEPVATRTRGFVMRSSMFTKRERSDARVVEIIR